IVYYMYLDVDVRDLHSFPTRRSSDLVWQELEDGADLVYELIGECTPINCDFPTDLSITQTSTAVTLGWAGIGNSYTVEYGLTGRSEEHTSELQSRENLVCRLLLEKKK